MNTHEIYGYFQTIESILKRINQTEKRGDEFNFQTIESILKQRCWLMLSAHWRNFQTIESILKPA